MNNGTKRAIKPLKPRHRKFLNSYLQSGNATKAAIEAGYTPRSAYSTGSEILKNPRMQAEINSKLEDITEDYLLRKAQEGIDGNSIDKPVRAKYIELLMKTKAMLIEKREVTSKRLPMVRDLTGLSTDELVSAVLERIKIPNIEVDVSENKTDHKNPH